VNQHFFFLVGFCLLLAHEMDAIRQSEWRLFPILKDLRDEWGYRVFTALHVPLYVLLLAPLIGAGASGPNQALIVALNWFFLIHLGLHIGLRRLPHYTFRSRFSWALISGAGAAGALDLFLLGLRGAP
jgi:hypothetical protein